VPKTSPPKTGFTIAGMTASQCGFPGITVPLLEPLYDPKGKLIPGKDCWGDILNEKDYALVYMGGADLNFQEKNTFYYNQGFAEVYGRDELLAETPELPTSHWGIYDDALIPRAQKKLEQLNTRSKPFGLIMLTLDAHAPQGFASPSCLNDYPGDSGILKDAHCSDKMLARFITKILKDPQYKDLIIVLASDHLAMGNDAGLEADDNTRENLWVAFNTARDGTTIRRSASTLDIASTFLYLIGYETSAFVFGRNLLSDNPTLTEQYGEEKFFKILGYWRRHLISLADERANETIKTSVATSMKSTPTALAR
jgi:phosphoglycerol transferase